MTRNYLEILAETIRNNWDQPALTDFYLTEDGSAQDTSRGNHYTYGEMYAKIVQVADLLTRLGLQKGDHIAICGANSAHWVIAYLAIAKMQGVSVTIMHSLQPDEIARLIDFSDAKALFVEKELWEGLREQSLLQVKNVIALEDWNVLVGEKQITNNQLQITNDQCQFVHGEVDELAMICFTSGTSGSAKGVMLSYCSISNNVLHSTLSYNVDASNRSYLSLLPWSHIYGLMCDVFAQLMLGKNIYINKVSTIMKIAEAILYLKPYALTTLSLVIMGIYEKSGSKFFEQLSRFCRICAIGGSKISPEVERLFVVNKIPMCIGYGTTETGPMISGETSYKFHKTGTCGRSVHGMKIEIAPNGEIIVNGENVMLGYYKDPEATARKIDADGWLHTGDKGHLDEDGYLYVEGRLEQDIIVLPNGENIRPDSIEALINAMPEVKESIVLAREGKLVAIVVAAYSQPLPKGKGDDIRRAILRAINPQLPLFSQLYDVEITDQPLARTEKQTIKRYLYR